MLVNGFTYTVFQLAKVRIRAYRVFILLLLYFQEDTPRRQLYDLYLRPEDGAHEGRTRFTDEIQLVRSVAESEDLSAFYYFSEAVDSMDEFEVR